MATSGTYAWTLDVTDILEDAYEQAGWEMRTGYDTRTARRSLNLIFADWVSRGVNLWTIELVTLPLVAGTASYTLASSTSDILDAVLRTTADGDIGINRIPIEEYLHVPDKTTQAQPSQWALQRNTSTPTLYLYPTPDDSTASIAYWRIRYVQDVTTMTENVDAPRRFLPALIKRLAYELSLKKPTNASDGEAAKADAAKRAELKNAADELFNFAKDEDRDRSSLYLRPKMHR